MSKPLVASKGGVTRNMHPEMSQLTRKEILTKMQQRYERAGMEYKSRLIGEVVELFGYHRKAAIRALRRRPRLGPGAPYVIGRPKEYDPDKLLRVLKPIWLAALQPCGKRLVAALPDWVRGYEQDHRPLDGICGRACCGPARRRWTGCCSRCERSTVGGAAPAGAPCCGRRFRFARNGPARGRAIWRWIP